MPRWIAETESSVCDFVTKFTEANRRTRRAMSRAALKAVSVRLVMTLFSLRLDREDLAAEGAIGAEGRRRLLCVLRLLWLIDWVERVDPNALGSHGRRGGRERQLKRGVREGRGGESGVVLSAGKNSRAECSLRPSQGLNHRPFSALIQSRAAMLLSSSQLS